MTTLRRTLVTGACALALLSVVVIARPTRGAELVPPKKTERLFPRFVFCPLPFDVQFTADGPEATLRISTSTVNYFDTNLGEATWSHQQIDDICITHEDDYVAHHGPLVGYGTDCYIGAPITETFYFQDAGAIPLKELFPATGPDPATTGWDLTHGCSWNTGSTAPNDPSTGDRTLQGCLDLGQFNPALSLSDSAYTTRTVTGLTAGQNYRLTGWWNVQTGTFEVGDVFLTVRIYGTGDPTPVVTRTWGALKRVYRDTGR